MLAYGRFLVVRLRWTPQNHKFVVNAPGGGRGHCRGLPPSRSGLQTHTSPMPGSLWFVLASSISSDESGAWSKMRVAWPTNDTPR